MLEKHWENRKDLEVIIDVAVTAGYLIAKEQIEVGDSRDLIDASIEIAEAFELKFKDFDWNDQPDGTFKSYVMEIDEFSEEELLKKYRKEEALFITDTQTRVEANVHKKELSRMPLIVRCQCGKSQVVSKELDLAYGQYYCVVECEECGYYWEGYMGYCCD